MAHDIEVLPNIGDQDVSVGLSTESDLPLSDSGEPSHKRCKTELIETELNLDMSLKHLLWALNKSICQRLDGIEGKVENILMRTKYLEEKIDLIATHVKLPTQPPQVIQQNSAKKSGSYIVGVPQSVKSESSGTSTEAPVRGSSLVGPNVQLITLNTEADFPNGVWLGDENNPEARVRVNMSSSDLIHLNTNCRTAEKMALTLLDYLFDRDTQAVSNISGMGKHGKKQLDPLLVYGIRCHLVSKFGSLSENDWHRIKQNIDSKCRTAFRRKVRGQPMTVKSFRGKNPFYGSQNGSDLNLNSDDSLCDDNELAVETSQESTQFSTTLAIQQGQNGEIQVLHATPEQLAHLQHAHHIQIFDSDQLQRMRDGQIDQVSVSLHNGLSGMSNLQEDQQVIQVDDETIDDPHRALEEQVQVLIS